jgi:NADH-quinone oxidoreductase subunit C
MQIVPALDPLKSLQEQFPEAIVFTKTFREEVTIVVQAEKIVQVMQYLRNTPGLVYNFLSDISSVDYYPHTPTAERPERFGVSYHVYSMLYNRRLRIKAFAAEDNPVIPTIISVYAAANWLEREIQDLMGIKFEGHPDQRRLLMPDDWNGHPARRDVPVGKEAVQFSFNVEDILKHKPRAASSN